MSVLVFQVAFLFSHLPPNLFITNLIWSGRVNHKHKHNHYKAHHHHQSTHHNNYGQRSLSNPIWHHSRL